MNMGTGWSKFAASANPTQFNPNMNNLQRNGSIRHHYNNYSNNDNYTSSPHQPYQNNNTNFSAAQNNFTNEKIRRDFTAPHTGKRSIIDDEFLGMFRQMVEIKKLRQNQLRSVGQPTGVGDIQQQFIGSQISNELIALSLINKNIIDNNRNVGFRGRLCYKCFSYWIDLVHNNKDEGMKSLLLEKPPTHECDTKKVPSCQQVQFSGPCK